MHRLLQWLQRHWVPVLIVVAFALFVLLQYNQLRDLATTLIEGQFFYIAVAIGIEIISLAIYAAQYQTAFAAVDVRSNPLHLYPVVLVSIFLKAAVPTGGLSSLAVFIEDAEHQGQSGTRAAEGALLVLVADLIAALPLIAGGLAYLGISGVLQVYQIIFAVFYVIFTAGLATLLLIGQWQPGLLRHLFAWAQENINWLAGRTRRRQILAEDWAQKTADQYIDSARDISNHPRPVGATMGIAFLSKVANAVIIYVAGLAFAQVLNLGEVLAAFAVNVIFSVVNIIPHGLGVAEGVITLTLTSLGIPGATAFAISVVFRGVNIWLPIIVGFALAHPVTASWRDDGNSRRGE